MGNACVMPHGQLIAEHTCPKCKQIVHILCGIFDPGTDSYICNRCAGSCSPSPPQQPSPKQRPVASELSQQQPQVPPQKSQIEVSLTVAVLPKTVPNTKK